MNAKKMPTPVDLIVFDFDGVMTDNQVIVFSDGSEAVKCNRSDGLGISMLKKSGIKMLVISTEVNDVVRERCKKLGLPCHNGVENKIAVLKKEAERMGVLLENTIFVGNDVNDLPAMNSVGYSVAVADSHKNVLKEADLILTEKGGKGAVRELADMILRRINSE